MSNYLAPRCATPIGLKGLQPLPPLCVSARTETASRAGWTGVRLIAAAPEDFTGL